MERSSFFNAELVGDEWDRVYLAEDYARYFASFIGNGVFPNPATGLQVVSIDNNMQIRVKQGLAWIKGYFYENTDDLILKIEPADGSLNRIDRIALRLDFINREIKIYVKKGVYGSNAIAPTLTRNADIYELGIADIKVNKGVIKIGVSDIIDTRLNKDLCGIVHGTVDQVDPTEIFNQYQKYLDEKISSNEFKDWLDSIKGLLEGDAALNLANKINQVELQVNDINTELKSIEVTAEKTTLNSSNFKSKNVKAGMEELFTSVSNGKKSIATAITGKGVQASSNDTHQQLANKIGEIETFKDNLLPFLPYKELYSTTKWYSDTPHTYGNEYMSIAVSNSSDNYSGYIYKIYKNYFTTIAKANDWTFASGIEKAVYIMDNKVWGAIYSKTLRAYDFEGTYSKDISFTGKIEGNLSRGRIYVDGLESRIYYYEEGFTKLIIFDFNGTILKNVYPSSIENPRIIGKYVIGETQSPYELKIYSLEGTILKRITRKYNPAFTEYSKLNNPVIIEDNLIRSIRGVYDERKLILFETVLDKLI